MLSHFLGFDKKYIIAAWKAVDIMLKGTNAKGVEDKATQIIDVLRDFPENEWIVLVYTKMTSLSVERGNSGKLMSWVRKHGYEFNLQLFAQPTSNKKELKSINSTDAKTAAEQMKVALFQIEKKAKTQTVSTDDVKDELVFGLKSKGIKWAYMAVIGRGQAKIESIYDENRRVYENSNLFTVHLFL